jgi:hypothetical protein
MNLSLRLKDGFAPLGERYAAKAFYAKSYRKPKGAKAEP